MVVPDSTKLFYIIIRTAKLHVFPLIFPTSGGLLYILCCRYVKLCSTYLLPYLVLVTSTRYLVPGRDLPASTGYVIHVLYVLNLHILLQYQLRTFHHPPIHISFSSLSSIHHSCCSYKDFILKSKASFISLSLIHKVFLWQLNPQSLLKEIFFSMNHMLHNAATS
jgi:hypothetical protein